MLQRQRWCWLMAATAAERPPSLTRPLTHTLTLCCAAPSVSGTNDQARPPPAAAMNRIYGITFHACLLKWIVWCRRETGPFVKRSLRLVLSPPLREHQRGGRSKYTRTTTNARTLTFGWVGQRCCRHIREAPDWPWCFLCLYIYIYIYILVCVYIPVLPSPIWPPCWNIAARVVLIMIRNDHIILFRRPPR